MHRAVTAPAVVLARRKGRDVLNNSMQLVWDNGFVTINFHISA